MNPFKDFDWSAKSIFKVFGVLLGGAFALSLVAMLISFSLRTVFSPSFSYDQSYATKEMAFDAVESYSRGGGISIKNAVDFGIIEPPQDGQAIDEDAENFEIQEYYITFRVNNKSKICQTVADLKPRQEVIFENANEGRTSCSYRFKVAKDSAEEILALLSDLDPDTLDQHTRTIQKIVQGMTDELEIHTKKLESVESTLKEAQTSYDELTALATRKSDIESLTKLIDLKLNTIDRLSKERMQITEQIDRITKSRAEQLEQLKYTNFSVNVYEDRIIDFEQIGNSWKSEFQRFFYDLNDMLQGVTVKLVSYSLRVLQALLYFFIAVAVLRGAWWGAKKVWLVGKK